MQIDGNTDDVVDTLMEATTERLVFVNTPESSESVRFDIRQLQEFLQPSLFTVRWLAQNSGEG